MSQRPVICACSLLSALRVCCPAWLTLGLVCGCAGAGGQTGTENPVPGEGGDDQCDVVSRRLTPDDASALGFSANDVLAWAVGEHTSTLLWEAPPELRELSPEQGQQGLTLELGAATAQPSLVHYSPKQAVASGPAVGVLCPPDQLSIPVTVRVTSGAGALDETLAVELQASHPRLASFSKRLKLSELGGSLKIVPQGDAVASAIQLEAAIYPGGTSGTLSGQLELGAPGTRDGVRGAMHIVYARWPLGARCAPTFGQVPVAVPLTTAFDGVSSSDVLLSANSLEARPLLWNNGDSTHLKWTLAPSTAFACASVGGALAPRGVSLDIPLDIRLETADERVAARVPGQLTTAVGSLAASGTVKLSGSLICDSGERDTWATACGMPHLAVTDHDALMLRFDATVSLAAPAGAVGLVEALGARNPICPNPTAPCSSIQWESLARGNLQGE
ncbi:MAG TPA: hypothetical protein VER33_08300 [Polyangiaceae bacterium]|nr:hypothetical protein [Polyangiaceae bacterium]